MNKTLIKNLNRKTKVYVGIILVCFASVFIRIGLVRRDRGRVIVSFVAEWDRFGKPVTVKKITAQDIPVHTKLTVRGVVGKRAAGFVTADIKDKLKIGQAVYFVEGDVPCGKILTLVQELDINTGMFPVEVEFNTPVTIPGSMLVIFARTQTLREVLAVPNSILDISQNNYYLWKITRVRL